jgi:hypothetical protein
MSKIMKHRTDNDIKNKWNSMRRSQQAREARFGYACTTFKESPTRQPQVTDEVASTLGESINQQEESIATLGLFTFAASHGRIPDNAEKSAKKATDIMVKQGATNLNWGPLQL